MSLSIIIFAFVLTLIVMRRVLLFAFLSIVSTIVCGQNAVSGIVLDSLTHEPLPYVNVYIDGTTKGTVTDDLGKFTLKYKSLPSTIVFSFVGYQPKGLELTQDPGDLLIELNPYNELPQIDTDGSERAYLLEYFKQKFLGEDRWGQNAIIKNDEVLFFDSNNLDKVIVRSEDPNELFEKSPNYESNSYDVKNLHPKYISNIGFKKNKLISFKAWTSAPLIIDMPLLGYEMYVDLVSFTVQEQKDCEDLCRMLGHFYFKPYDIEKESKNKKIEKNRLLAYYSSSQHFLHSWYQGRLKENGYIIVTPSDQSPSIEVKIHESLKATELVPLDISQYSKTIEDVGMQVYGLKGKKLNIIYFHKHNGSPKIIKDGSDYPDSDYSVSEIIVLKDTCMFLKDGTVIDNDIIFMGDMSKSRVASFLPNDYVPNDE